jgi:histone deacetylase 1/2
MPEDNEYREYFCPEYKIHMPVSNMENMNTKEDLESVLSTVMERLKTVYANSIDLSAFQNKNSKVPDHLDYDDSKKIKI